MSYAALVTYMYTLTLSDCAEGLKTITSVVCGTKWTEKGQYLYDIICYLHLKGSPKEVSQGYVGNTQGGSPFLRHGEKVGC